MKNDHTNPNLKNNQADLFKRKRHDPASVKKKKKLQRPLRPLLGQFEEM